jgi:hypothetical protein
VTRTFKIVCLAIGVAAFAVLAFFGMAVWVFIPLLPTAIVYLLAVAMARRRATYREKKQKEDFRKAA